MFTRSGKRPTPNKNKSLKALTAVCIPDDMLKDKTRQELIDHIEAAMALDASRFESLALTLIHHFINHAQSLPETLNSYYSKSGGILDYSLNRTEVAMSLFRELTIAEKVLSEEQKLWGYALFSASLLKGIGKLQIDYQVELYDHQGQHQKRWNPLLESMLSIARNYHYQLLGEHDIELRKRLNLLLARLLMPNKAFEWIASNPEVLRVWLALIDEDWESAGTLGALLERADAIAIQRYILQFMRSAKDGKTSLSGRIGTFIDNGADQLIEREIACGVEFINWLMQCLERGKLTINQSPLFMVPGGMLMSSDMFKLFVREHPEYKNWQAVQNAFLAIGVHELGPEGAVNSKFEQKSNQQIISGIVMNKFGVALPEQVQVQNIHTGVVSSQQALKLIHNRSSSSFTQQNSHSASSPIQQLNAKGIWVETAELGPNLSPGGFLRG